MAYFGLVGNKKVQEILQKLAYYAILLSRSPFFMANPVQVFEHEAAAKQPPSTFVEQKFIHSISAERFLSILLTRLL